MNNRGESVEQLNVVLMIVACAAAFAAPFHVFLFAYAVLGPLHYLTEISWLHDRDYFAPRRTARRWWLALVGATMAVLLYGYVANDLLKRPVAPTLEIGMVYLVFATAAMLLFVRHAASAVALIGVVVVTLALFSDARAYALLAYFIVTILHVFLFTAAFVLYGALKRKSRQAVISLAVYAACVASFFILQLPAAVAAAGKTREVYGFFEPLNAQLLALFGSKGANLYESPAGVAIMRMIAFAYTYHYLNWFSKTAIIKWHQVTRVRATMIIGASAAATLLYLHDYAAGLSALYVLSLLHVLLEFPLNHQTFIGIGSELRALRRA